MTYYINPIFDIQEKQLKTFDRMSDPTTKQKMQEMKAKLDELKIMEANLIVFLHL